MTDTDIRALAREHRVTEDQLREAARGGYTDEQVREAARLTDQGIDFDPWALRQACRMRP